MASYVSALRAAAAAEATPGGGAFTLPACGAGGAPLRVAVVDANAIIRGVRLERLADAAVTVPAVFAEVRDGPSRAALASLPFGLATRDADAASLAAVRRFARLTGDAAVLSGVDTQLLALTLMLETAAHGSAHLRETPPPPRPAARRKKGSKSATPMPGWDFVENAAEWEALEAEEAAAAAALAGGVVVGGGAGAAVAAGGAAAGGGAVPAAAAADEQRASRVAAGVQTLSLSEAPVRGARAQRRAAQAAAQPPHAHASALFCTQLTALATTPLSPAELFCRRCARRRCRCRRGGGGGGGGRRRRVGGCGVPHDPRAARQARAARRRRGGGRRRAGSRRRGARRGARRSARRSRRRRHRRRRRRRRGRQRERQRQRQR
jgi:RNA-binding protein NOB1